MIDLSAAPDDDILARTIIGEARGGGAKGMSAVASVVMNRVAKPGWWGSTAKEVCLKPYQFSCWLLGDPNRQFIMNVATDSSLYQAAHVIAQKAIDGGLPDITQRVRYYYASSMKQPPKWANGHTPCAEIAGMYFFNDIL